MTHRNVSQAKSELSALLVLVENGEEVVICRAGRPIAKLVAMDKRREPRRGGQLAGKWSIPDSFNDPDPELEELFYGGSIEPTP